MGGGREGLFAVKVSTVREAKEFLWKSSIALATKIEK